MDGIQKGRKRGKGLQCSEIKKDEKYEYCEIIRNYDYGDDNSV